MNLRAIINELRQKEQSFHDLAAVYGEAANCLEQGERGGHPAALAVANEKLADAPEIEADAGQAEEPKTIVDCPRCGRVVLSPPNRKTCPECKRLLPGKSWGATRKCMNCGRAPVDATGKCCAKCGREFPGSESPGDIAKLSNEQF